MKRVTGFSIGVFGLFVIAALSGLAVAVTCAAWFMGQVSIGRTANQT